MAKQCRDYQCMYCMDTPELPLKGNYNQYNYKIYFKDTGLLIGSLDEEAQVDLRHNKNYNTYKGAIYENIVADMLVKQGYPVYFYRNETGTIEMEFFYGSLLFNIFLKRFLCDERHQNVLSKLEVIKSE